MHDFTLESQEYVSFFYLIQPWMHLKKYYGGIINLLITKQALLF